MWLIEQLLYLKELFTAHQQLGLHSEVVGFVILGCIDG